MHLTPKQIDVAKRVIRQHYNLPRQVTEEEVLAEIAMLERRGKGYLDDRLLSLKSRLEIAGIEIADKPVKQ